MYLYIYLIHLSCTIAFSNILTWTWNLKVYRPNIAWTFNAWICCSSYHEVILQHGTNSRERYLLPVPAPRLPRGNSGYWDVAWRTEVMPCFLAAFWFGRAPWIHSMFLFSVEGCTTELRWKSAVEQCSQDTCYSKTSLHHCKPVLRKVNELYPMLPVTAVSSQERNRSKVVSRVDKQGTRQFLSAGVF